MVPEVAARAAAAATSGALGAMSIWHMYYISCVEKLAYDAFSNAQLASVTIAKTLHSEKWQVQIKL